MKKLYSLFLGLIAVSAGMAQVDAGPDQIICSPQLVTISGSVTGQMGTTAYSVSSIPWAPEVVGGTTVSLTDDAVSGAQPIGFSFCFLGNTYTNFYIGSNGWLGFSAGQPTTFTSAPVPSTAANVPKNCIMGPWQDWNPGIAPGGYIKYQTIGVAPNRKLVCTWDNIPMFSCTSVTGKFQIVLHETTNIIENHVFNKQFCSWAGGTATQAIHNAAGTTAYVVPGRNSTVWTATNESWRYTPAGIQWLVNGNVITSNLTFTVTPQVTTNYVLSVPMCGMATITDTITVVVGTGLNYSLSSVSSSSCNTPTGSISVNATGGSGGPITYQWDDPNQSTTPNISDLAPGTYTVIITDENTGCSDEEVYVVEEESTLELSGTSVPTSCYNGTDGSATVIATSDFPGYTYDWNVPGGQDTDTVTGLPAGSYSVTVTDADGCEETTLVTVTEPTALSASVPILTNASCFGAADGEALAVANGGTPGYSFSWSTGGEENVVSGLAAGEYTLTVTDANNCQTVQTINIGQPDELVVNFDADNVSCGGTDDGSATALPTGGTGSYDYLWTDSQSTSATISNLSPGDYEITVTDDNDCVTTAVVTIEPGAVLELNPDIQSVSCFGDTDGSVTLNVEGGTPDYQYTWDDPNAQTTATASNLAPGTYNVLVVDANGCEGTAQVNVPEPAPLSASIAQSADALCFGTATGSASVSIVGGTAQFEVLWTGGYSGQTVNTLPAGDYDVSITDANGCTAETFVSIGQPTQLIADASGISPLCFGGTDGSASVSVSGGVGGYEYEWTNSGSSSNTAQNLSAGTYTVTVTDDNGCEVSDTVQLTQPSAIVASTDSDPATCGLADGSVSASASGGNGPYTYNWPGLGETGAEVDLVEAGSYTVVVTDASGCTTSASVNVGTINEPVANANASISEGYEPLNVSFTNLSQNASTYIWDFGDGTVIEVDGNGIVNHSFGADDLFQEFTVTVTAINEGGCTDEFTIDIMVYGATDLELPNVFTPNGDSDNPQFQFFNDPSQAENIEVFECIVFNRWGKEVYRWDNAMKGWDGKDSGGGECPSGTYYYIMTATGYDGKEYDVEGYVTIFR